MAAFLLKSFMIPHLVLIVPAFSLLYFALSLPSADALAARASFDCSISDTWQRNSLHIQEEPSLQRRRYTAVNLATVNGSGDGANHSNDLDNNENDGVEVAGSSSAVSTNNSGVTPASNVGSFDDAVHNRYACTRYKRYDGIYDGSRNPSPSDPSALKLAGEALDLACRAPTGFNVQPYKLLIVTSPAAKERLSRFCIGRNKDRVLDSDCSVVFLADREAMRTWKDYRSMLVAAGEGGGSSGADGGGRSSNKSRLGWLKLRVLVALFSSGLPLPKVLGGPVSFFVRLAMRMVSWVTRSRLVVPTLSSPECWSQKNTMLVAATYMLACSARGLDTTPMEGYLSWGIRQSLGIPRRYTIPLVVSTGTAIPLGAGDGKNGAAAESDDAGMGHGNTPETKTPRFSREATIYENAFP
ncbi:unnamed protein product [Pseudo-nitzschia multistriata]|uniref:Nitroreductase domain-containing protein n=1 Tax=Pseudo-nitzschia multistriata TaxID=183589 RepID=A0A448ZDJ0_9STRA|nr:unnamed protein product [Pseudo-nitzschia multistriata]